MQHQRDRSSCRHYFFDRNGGVSGGKFASLNVGWSVGDSAENVAENYRLIKGYASLDVLIRAHQVHGDRIAIVGQETRADTCIDGVDALITDVPGVGLMVQLADCQGILLHAPAASVIAAIHCGWRGSVADLIGKTIRRMIDHFAVDPADLFVYVGPSLGPCCGEFRNYRTELPELFHQFQVKPTYFDFWEISRHQLHKAGVDDRHITISRVCTSCSPDYFSYRRACRTGDGVTGRHCALIRR